MSEPSTKLTVLVIIVLIALAVAYDVWTLVVNGWKTTISYLAWESGAKNHLVPMIVALVVGGLLAHFWWPACICQPP